jgi:excisionase family DNA binding protein
MAMKKKEGRNEFARLTITISEAAGILGISRSTAYESVRNGTFPVAVIKIGKRLVISRAAIEQVLGTPPIQR